MEVRKYAYTFVAYYLTTLFFTTTMSDLTAYPHTQQILQWEQNNNALIDEIKADFIETYHRSHFYWIVGIDQITIDDYLKAKGFTRSVEVDGKKRWVNFRHSNYGFEINYNEALAQVFTLNFHVKK